MIDAELLLTDTKKLVVDLVDDLRAVAANDAAAGGYVDDEYRRAHSAGRTAFGKAEWAEGLFAQVAVAWVLGGVFVRFCEDNGLIDEPLLGGPGIRSQLALDQRAEHLRANPSHDDRHWLREVFGRLRALPATGEIFGAHNPVWAEGLFPSADGARKLREELTRIDADSGELRHNFTDPEWDTRFLGDLYQDLSEHAKKTYALLQTPVFVEEFILDRTLEPAITTFGLTDATIIDPTCGSGHFLLGAFKRLFHRWIEDFPSVPRRELAQRSLDAIAGIDVNPFAATIARFRLLVAALQAGGDDHLANAPSYRVQVAVGDSLLHGDPPGALPGLHVPGDEESLLAEHGYDTEDVDAVRELLGRQWTTVVGNPPYIVARDAAMNSAYRRRFATCARKYSLAVPFTERFWQLASRHPTGPGYIGMLTADSFMKREMGKKLIEQWFPSHNLTHIVDTGGVRLAGHGTPTVLLFGRSGPPTSGSSVRVVMRSRSDPPSTTDAATGPSWVSIVAHIDDPGFSDDFISVVDMPRLKLGRHPWSLGGGGAAELKEALDQIGMSLESALDGAIGFGGVCGADDAMVEPIGAASRYAGGTQVLPIVEGADVRDWSIATSNEAFFPYHDTDLIEIENSPAWLKRLWPQRTSLWARATFGRGTYRSDGRPWWEWHQVVHDRMANPPIICFADVSTHNHFSLDTEARLYSRTAPVFRVLPAAGRDTSKVAVCLLNSSVIGFWSRQVFQRKDSGLHGSSEPWEYFYARDGSKLGRAPLALEDFTLSEEMRWLVDEYAGEVSRRLSSSRALDGPSIGSIAAELDDLQSRAVAAQEHIDWYCYRLYGLTDHDLTLSGMPEPPLRPGERAFEIVLARRMQAGEESSAWFTRHRSTPMTDLPTHWSPEYRNLVERRIELIEDNSQVRLIERPENKRRWLAGSWSDEVANSARRWLLNRLEDGRYWPEPATISTVARLTSIARADDDFVKVAKIFVGREDVDLADLVGSLTASEAVAYLAAQRYTTSGLRKYDVWCSVWELQRLEDAGEKAGTIPVPPTYAKSDFVGVGWDHRGKLDTPKERFICYPGAERETDSSMVIGWAGWNHLDRARALAAWYLQARRDGRDTAHLTPLLAGLAELVPWLRQWYDEPDPDPALDRPGTQIAALVDTETRSLGLTPEALTEWRPEKKRGGRRRKASS